MEIIKAVVSQEFFEKIKEYSKEYNVEIVDFKESSTTYSVSTVYSSGSKKIQREDMYVEIKGEIKDLQNINERITKELS
jgi:hypothetical protein